MFPVWNLCLLLMRSSPVWNLYAVASGMEKPSQVTQVVELKTNSSLDQLILGSNAQVEVVILGGQVSTMENIASPQKKLYNWSKNTEEKHGEHAPHILLKKKIYSNPKGLLRLPQQPCLEPKKRNSFHF